MTEINSEARRSLALSFARNVRRQREIALDESVLPYKQKMTDLLNTVKDFFSETSFPVAVFLNDVCNNTEKSSCDVRNTSCYPAEVCYIPENIYRNHSKTVVKERGNEKQPNCATQEVYPSSSLHSQIICAHSKTGISQNKVSSIIKDCVEWQPGAPNIVDSRYTAIKECSESMARISEELEKHSSASHRQNEASFDDSSKCQTITNSKDIPERKEVLNIPSCTGPENFYKNSCEISSKHTTTMKNMLVSHHFLHSKIFSDAFHVETVKEVIKALNEIDLNMLKQTLEENVVKENPGYNKRTTDVETKCSYLVSHDNRNYKSSPHVKKKFSCSKKDILTLETRYISMKTDIFKKSTMAFKDIQVGMIDISVQYLIVTKRLKVTINDVRNIKQLDGTRNCTVCVTLIGKENQKKKRTKVARCQKDESTHCDIYFNKIGLEEVHLLCLAFKVHKMSGMLTLRRSACVGECFVYLDDHDVVGKIQISEKLMESL